MQHSARPLEAGDLEAVVALCRAYAVEVGERPDDARVRAGLIGLLERPHYGTTLVLDGADGLIGYAVVTLGWSLESGGVDALLDEVYLVPHRRGRGLGTSMVEAAVTAARRVGARRIYLEVEAGNDAARRLYARLGWQAEQSTMMLRWLDEP